MVNPLVVFVRGANVGGHRRFRPTVLARELGELDVSSIGAAGTFVVRKPGSRAKLMVELRQRLPFDATIVICGGRDLLRLARSDPFGARPARADETRFVSILSSVHRGAPALPVSIPSRGRWLVHLISADERFVCGVYRRHMKTISCLGQIDELFGCPATTRSWTTIASVLRLLRGGPHAKSHRNP